MSSEVTTVLPVFAVAETGVFGLVFETVCVCEKVFVKNKATKRKLPVTAEDNFTAGKSP